MNWSRTLTVARTDVKQLVLAKDFWMPMGILGSIFFVIVPLVLLFSITSLGDVDAVRSIADTLEVLPERAQAQIKGDTPQGRTSYALAVFLFAPMAVVVPLTISTAVGAATLVGERERGTGEFLAHSPAGTKEIYLGKLLASLLPGYFTTMVGFTAYSLIVNLIVGPEVGGWFFPTTQWWLLMLWVLPGFLLIGLSLVLRLSGRVKSTAAAQQASGLITLPLIAVSYAQASGAIYGTAGTTIAIGAIAWTIGIASTVKGMSAVKRQRLLGVADGV
ncbi:MAG: ABC transporter permease subunit [Acidimicrobiales bacterium]|nr:ABC transporter permease subunit [Acidimicrobiales bacterium]